MYVVMSSLASHIDTTVLADGTYELIPESELDAMLIGPVKVE